MCAFVCVWCLYLISVITTRNVRVVARTSYYTNINLLHIALNNKYNITLLNIKLFT